MKNKDQLFLNGNIACFSSGKKEHQVGYCSGTHKVVLSFMLMLLVCIVKPCYGDTFTWALTANGSGVVNPANGNITLGAVATGANLPLSSFGVNGFSTAGNATKKGWNESNLTLAGSNNAFIEFSLTLNCAVSSTITAVKCSTKTSAGTITTGNSQLSYSTDNFATFTVVGSFSTNATTTLKAQTFPAFSKGVLANQTIKFRIYGAGIGSDTDSLSVKDFIVTGTVTATSFTVSAGSAFTKTCTSNANGAQIGEGNVAGNTYAWNPALGLSSTTASNPTANPTLTTTYTVTKTNTATGCTSTASVIVTVNNTAPSVSAGSAFTKTCTSNASGAQIGEANVAGNTYAWNPALGLSSSTASNPTANPTTTTTYTVTKTTTSNGCTATATVLVTVNATVPSVSAGSPFSKTCISNTNGAQIGEPNVSGNTYTWSPGLGLSSTTVSSPTANPTTTTTYTVTKTNTASGCSSTASVIVTVNNTAPTVSAGSSFTKTCTSNANGAQVGEVNVAGNSYAWSPVLGLSSTTASNPTANPTTTTTYTVTKTTTSSGCTATATVLVTVNAALPSVSAGTGFTKTCVSNTSGAQIGEINVAGNTYAWAPAAGLNSTTASDPIANPTTTTTYTVTKTNTSNGCSATATVLVTVNNSPPGVNAGSPFAKTCVSNISGAPIGEANVAGNTYSWAPATGLSSTTVSNPTANPLTTTTYTVTKTNTASGCTSTASVTVTVNNTPPTVNPGTAFSKTCVSNINGNAIGEANQAGNTYAWSPSTGLSSSTLSNPTANPGVTTTYTVVKTTTTSGCTASGTVIVTVDTTKPSLVTSNDTLICSGSVISLTANGADIYAWTPGTGLNQTTGSTVAASPTNTQTYSITGTTSSNGCTSTASIVVTVNQPSVAPASISGTSVLCDGQSTLLTLQGGTKGTGADFKWYSGSCGGTSEGSGNSITVSPTTVNNQPLTIDYFVRAEGPAPCPLNTSCATLTVTVNPIPRLNSPVTATMCSGDQLLYSIVPTFSNNVSYSWNSTAPVIISGNSQNQPGGPGFNNIPDLLVNSTINNPAQVDYNITLTFTNSGLSCSSDSNLIVTVNPAAPIPDVTSIDWITGSTICGGSDFLSFNIKNPPTGITYSWTADPSSIPVDISDTLQGNNDSINVVISFPDLASAYQGTIHVQANNLTSLGGCKSKEKDLTFNVVPGGITERLIVPRQPGNLLIYLDNSVDGYQWGYDSLPTLKPHFISGQVFQILALSNKDTSQFFSEINGKLSLDTINYLFWVLVYELNGNGDTCKTKVYYNGSFAKRPGPIPDPVSPEIRVNLFPNPNSGAFEMEISGNIFGPLTMEVYNLIGQQVSKQYVTKTEDRQTYPIDLQHPDKGLYMIRVSDDFGYTYQVKLLIN